MLEKGVILPNLHFERPNRKISFEQIVVPTTVVPWPEGVRRRASVNSFGYGGTNAHVIVEAFVAPCSQSRDDDLRSAHDDGLERPLPQRLFVLTGREQSTIREMRLRYASYIQTVKDTASPSVKFDDLSYTLGQRRSRLDWAEAHVASSFKELGERLSAPEVVTTRSSNKARVGFVFTGQGAQWPRMGLELMEYTAFRDSVEAAGEYLTQKLDCSWIVIEELEKHGDESRVRSSELGQPLCTIVQVAMVDLLGSWNVRPTAVVGHSSGEIAAAYCTGVITKQAAWQIAFHRGRECAKLNVKAPELEGAMLAVGLGAESIRPYLNDLQSGRINVACVNSPNSITISGDAPEVRKLQAMLVADSVFARELPVENAYHSHHMELVEQSYLHSMSGVDIQQSVASSDITMVSSVTGQSMEPSELTPEYWVRNLVSPVLFADAVTAMLRGSKRSFRRSVKAEPAVDFLLELGPHATLQTPLLDIVKAEALEDVKYASMLLRGKNATDSAMTTAGSLYCHGCPVDVTAVNDIRHECRVLVDLPAYPWNRSTKYWGVSRLMQGYLHRAHGHHSLLGARLIGSDALNPAWRHLANLEDNPWIKEHVVHGATLYPGAGFLAMAIEAALQLAEPGREVANVRLENVRVVKALILKEGEGEPEVITRFRQGDIVSDGASSKRWEFEISCAKGPDKHEQRITGQDEFERHATGRITLDYQPERPYLSPLGDLVHEARRGEYAKLADTCVDTMKQDEFYEASKDAGLDYGPDFQGIVTMARGTGSCCWSVQITERSTSLAGVSESKHLIHPATLDAIVHSLFGAMNRGKEFKNAALPVAFDSITISTEIPNSVGASLSGFTVIREAKEREFVADIHVSSGEWTQPLVQITGLRCTEMPSQQGELRSPVARPSPVGTITYRPDIELFDEDGLMSYINDKQKPQSPARSHPVLYSERLRDAVAQVRSFPNGSDDENMSDSVRRWSSLPCSRILGCQFFRWVDTITASQTVYCSP
jgi:acyl transferase domain-containing protein